MSLVTILIGIAIVAVIGYAFYVYIPIGNAPRATKSLMEMAVPYSQSPESPTKQILVMGDSTAVGTGGSPSQSIAGRLGARYPSARIVNDSENGMKLEVFLERFELRKSERYDFIVFQIGANDVIGLTSEADMRKRLEQSLSFSSTMAPCTIVMSAGNIGLAPVFRFPLTTLYTKRSKEMRVLYMDVISKFRGAYYVDLYNEREDEPFNTDIPRFYAADRFHPSGDGYAIWFKKVEKFL